jgi:hypothetical protein
MDYSYIIFSANDIHDRRFRDYTYLAYCRDKLAYGKKMAPGLSLSSSSLDLHEGTRWPEILNMDNHEDEASGQEDNNTNDVDACSDWINPRCSTFKFNLPEDKHCPQL